MDKMQHSNTEGKSLPDARYFRTRPVPPGWTGPRLGADINDVIVAADRAAEGLVEVVGIKWAFPDNRIGWTFNPTLENGPYNPEWTWQLNRMYFWSRLAAAYRETGDEKYARAFARQLGDWLEQTGGIPPETGYNDQGSPWRTIEEGIRLHCSWSVAFETFRKSPSVPDELLLAFARSAHAQARHVLAHRTGGNWLLIEMTGVIVFALEFPEFADSGAMLAEALRVFCEAAEAQLLPDGMHNELTPDYHLVFHHDAVIVYLRLRAAGISDDMAGRLKSLIERGAEGLLALITPGFSLPRVNDTFLFDDTSRLFAGALDVCPERSDFKWAATRGREGLPPVGNVASRFLPFAGFAAMRTGWTENALFVVFDVGPLGERHWHQDKLSFSLWKGGEELVFDDGGGQYEDSALRQYSLSGHDHSTMLVDGLAENRLEPRSLKTPVDAGWRSTPEEDFTFGVYDQGFGPEMLPLAKWRREMRLDKKSQRLFVDDSVESSDDKEHEFALLFQLDATDVSISDDGRRLKATYGAGRKWALEMSFSEGVAVELASGRVDPSPAGWYFGREATGGKVVRPATTVFVKKGPCMRFRFETVFAVVPAPGEQREASL